MIPLGALRQALSYWDIRLNTEPSAQWELADGVPYSLKLVLRSTHSQ